MGVNPFEDHSEDKSGLKILSEKLRRVPEALAGVAERVPFLPKPKAWVGEGDDDNDEVTKAFVISLIVFILYGLIGGYIISSNVQYRSWIFSDHAFGVGFLEGRLLSSPLTVFMTFVFIVFGGLIFGTFSAVIYGILRLVFFRKHSDEINEKIGQAFSLSFLFAVFAVIFVLLKPDFNFVLLTTPH